MCSEIFHYLLHSPLQQLSAYIHHYSNHTCCCIPEPASISTATIAFFTMVVAFLHLSKGLFQNRVVQNLICSTPNARFHWLLNPGGRPLVPQCTKFVSEEGGSTLRTILITLQPTITISFCFSLCSLIACSRLDQFHCLPYIRKAIASTVVLYIDTRMKILVETDVRRACKRKLACRNQIL